MHAVFTILARCCSSDGLLGRKRFPVPVQISVLIQDCIRYSCLELYTNGFPNPLPATVALQVENCEQDLRTAGAGETLHLAA